MLDVGPRLAAKFRLYIGSGYGATGVAVFRKRPEAATGPDGDGRGPPPVILEGRVLEKVPHKNSERLQKKKFLSLRIRSEDARDMSYT